MTQDAVEGRAHSWWATIPGIFTAIGGVITAVAVLVATLHQAGLVGTTVAPTPSTSESSQRLSKEHSIQPIGVTPQTKIQQATTALPPQNASYRIGIVVAGYPESEFNIIKNAVLSRGFELNDKSARWPEYERWMPPEPTVHYYKDSNMEKARSIASLLKQETGFDFKVSRGKGLGMTEDEYPFAFTIHLNRGP